jgi:hypothetical protein
VSEFDRNSILICYSDKENRRPSFCSDFEQQLQGLRLTGLNLADLRVAKLAAEGLGRRSGHEEIRRELTRARIVLLLEGPSFLTSGFFLVETDFLENLGVVERYAATRVFRIPIHHVNEQLVPESLRVIAPAWPLANVTVPQRPLADLNVPQRNAAMSNIMDSIVDAFRGWQPPPPDDDFAGDPPFRIDRGNLVHPIEVYPKRILDWTATEEFQSLASNLSGGVLDPGFVEWMQQVSRSESPLYPAWKLELPEVAPTRLLAAPVENCVRVEQYAARLYPRHRDAQTVLYESLNDLHLLDIADRIEPHSEVLASLRDRIRMRDRSKYEMKHHIHGVMRSLLRKHGAFWRATEDLWQRLNPARRARGDRVLEEYHVVWQCIPLCQLGILQRLDYACSGRVARRSLLQCYTLLERMNHWLHVSNQLMNKVDSVSGYQLIRAQSIRD